jgi:hypothetical protein
MVLRGAITMIVIVMVCSNLGADDEKPFPEIKAVAQSLDSLWKDLDPPPKIAFTNRGRSVEIEYLPQTFKIHHTSKTGEISADAQDEVGPSYKGFLLKIHLQPKGEVNQIVTPFTITRPYWLTDLDVTPLAKTDSQIYWALSYGSRMNKDVLKEIRQRFSRLSQ